MSDLSIGGDYEFPYEVKSAGHSGLGAFATRDIKPGEIILVDFSSIVITTGDRFETFQQVVERYEALDELAQEEWRALASHIRPNAIQQYLGFYARLKPDGTRFFTTGSAELYAGVNCQFDSNSFALLDTGKCALYLAASRFNHSCDPNVWYENTEVEGRWVGRANRNIAQGEELFVTYLANHGTLAERQVGCQDWGFSCDCNKCLQMIDHYTSFLEDARAVANDAAVDWARSLSFWVDNVEEMGRHLTKRVDLLRSAHNDNIDEFAPGGDRSPRKELIFALWDLAWFHEHNYLVSRMNSNKAKFVEHLESAINSIKQAISLATSMWPRTHEIINLIHLDSRRWQRTWDNRNTPPLGLAD